ncbi:MAG: cytoplasmic protein [Deltaproteobacteria bacterium]|nr:cytoplasmic protein [Deltaproteobacteria bacterium]MBW2075576.1 cytoplasmic protein [Deltaproteobacteria bacterium]RLB80704.1 MAG: cytoplasmic protein [Deltaproteobacteria bacterium]
MQHGFIANQHRFPPRESNKQQAFKEFEASELFCPQCNRAVPVRKRLLLVLPEGDKYEYLCAFCATSVGTKLVRGANDQMHIII